MSWRGTLLLLLMAGLAVGFFIFSERSITHPPEQSLLGIDPALANRIEITEGGSHLELIKVDNLWRVGSSLDQQKGLLLERANPKLIHSLLETAADITPLDILRASDLKGSVTLASLGLKKPNRSIIIQAGKKQTLWLGVEGAAPGSLYARLDSGKTVYLISGKIASLAFRPVMDYRDPRLEDWNSDQITEVSLTKGDALQQLKLTKNPKAGNSFKKGWYLTCPTTAKADDQTITAWLDTLLGSQITRWMPEGTDPASCGLDIPTAIVTLCQEKLPPRVLKIGAPVPDSPSSYFVQCNDRSGICVVGGAIPATLAVAPQNLRSKKVTQVDYDTVDRMEINQLFLSRKAGSDDWIFHDDTGTNNQLIAGEQMKQWYDRLQGLSALRFELATTEHLNQYGLTVTNQILTIRLIATLSENTAQENAGNTVLSEYHFGLATNDEVALREGDSSEIMILPASATEFLKAFANRESKP